ncbi:MAG: hypothetical protein ACE5I7_03740 [Candidatus Binatia bacterium]
MRYVHVIGIGMLAVVAACGTNSEELKKVKESQRKIQAKLAQLEKKVNQVAARPAARPRPRIDPNKVYKIPAGNSPFRGPADAPVVLTEFSDFQ